MERLAGRRGLTIGERGSTSQSERPERGRTNERGRMLDGQEEELGSLVGTLPLGSSFGEQSFLTNSRSKATIRTVDYTELMSLHRDHLETIFETNERLRELVMEFLDDQKRKYSAINEKAAGHDEKLKTRGSNFFKRLSLTGSTGAKKSKQPPPAIPTPSGVCVPERGDSSEAVFDAGHSTQPRQQRPLPLQRPLLSEDAPILKALSDPPALLQTLRQSSESLHQSDAGEILSA